MEPMYRRLTSPHSDLIIKTHPYAEIVWWGSTLKVTGSFKPSGLFPPALQK